MKNKGFYIKSLVATGRNVAEARIDFIKGCNLIFGKSDTGKSHILHLIEYLLGKNKLEATVVEGREYDCYYLEIAEYSNDNIFTMTSFMMKIIKENIIIFLPPRIGRLCLHSFWD